MSTLAKDRKTEIKTNAKHENDTGSSEVQIALLTARINDLTEYLHAREASRRRGLLKRVAAATC